MIGTVKWFSQEKGFGFITAESGDDHYFKVSDVVGAVLPSNGDTVEFQSKKGNKGLFATNIEILVKSNNNKFVDDRINCPECGKKIVPRMITYNGSPSKSVCPYCATTIKEFSKCFIATAVYGDGTCPEVMTLRRFRDETLLPNFLGEKFVSFYYKVSPPIAIWLKSKPNLSAIIRFILNYLVKIININKK